MLTLCVFLDYANINRGSQERGIEFDYGHLLNFLADGRQLTEAFAYVPIDPRSPAAMDETIELLWMQSYIVRTKIGKPNETTYKCDFDVELAMDVVRVAEKIKPNIIVLASGDGDFVPLVEYVRSQGIRVEVAGFPGDTAKDLRLKCSGFINLEEYVAEVAHEERGEDGVNLDSSVELEGEVG